MSETMMALGSYRFALENAAFSEFKRSISYRWQSQERLNRSPALQYIGEGQDSIDLSGVIYPHFKGGLNQIEAMRSEAGKGVPLLLVDGLGFVWGKWVIANISEEQTMLMPNGKAQKQTFQIKLLKYGDDQ